MEVGAWFLKIRTRFAIYLLTNSTLYHTLALIALV